MNLPLEVFLSHSSKDREFATSVSDIFRSHGIPVWYSQTNIVGGQQWIEEIGSALNRCDWFAVILSPDSIKSMWVKREVSYALMQQRFENRIIPILLQDCEIEELNWSLSLFQIISFINRDFEDGIRDLLRTWGVGFRGS